jgi:hypothetical protein
MPEIMATTNSSEDITPRATLKKLFADGARPSGADFSAIIDSFVHRSDLNGAGYPSDSSAPSDPANAPPAANGTLRVGERSFNLEDELSNVVTLNEGQQTRLALGPDGQWTVPGGGETPVPLKVDGWFGAAARVGTYRGAASSTAPTQVQFPDGTAVAPGKVPADGKWHVVLPALNGCCAFEIVAQASGAVASGRHAILHAIVLTAFNGSRKGLRVTRTARGWSWLRRLELRWQPRRSSWFQSPDGYDLALRTHFGYGNGSDGQPAQIRFHITRLW